MAAVMYEKGPVRVVEMFGDWCVRNTSGVVAQCLSPGLENGKEVAAANARRIVATWNACEGIPTEALEEGVVREMIEALEALVDELEWEIGEEKWGRDPDALPMARAVLAKVWGEAS